MCVYVCLIEGINAINWFIPTFLGIPVHCANSFLQAINVSFS